MKLNIEAHVLDIGGACDEEILRRIIAEALANAFSAKTVLISPIDYARNHQYEFKIDSEGNVKMKK